MDFAAKGGRRKGSFSYICRSAPDSAMKILTLNLKFAGLGEILAGTRTHEYRDIFPSNEKRFIRYVLNGKEYTSLQEMPSEEEEPGEVDVVPVKYDCIKFMAGAVNGTRPYLVVEVVEAEVVFLTDEEGKDLVLVDEENDLEYIAAQMDYTLGKVIERSGC